MQVASRILLVWGVVNNFPYLARSPAYSTMLIAWSITEVVRYSYFVFTLSGYKPGFISWLRYNTFFVLYPLGISSECWLIYKAIGPAKKLRQEYAWALQAILLVYVPGKLTISHLRGLVSNLVRILYPFHTHDGSTKKSHKRSSRRKERVKVILESNQGENNHDRQRQILIINSRPLI